MSATANAGPTRRQASGPCDWNAVAAWTEEIGGMCVDRVSAVSK
jgi:hypothetical protein